MATPREGRVSTAIILATLALCALFLAQGTTRVLAAELLDKDAAEAERTRKGISTGTPAFQRRRDATIILRRNIFDSARGDLTLEPIAAGPGGDGVPLTEWDPSQPPPKCTGKLRLVGSVVSPGYPDWSFAAIAGSEGKTLLYRKGSTVESSYVLAVRSSSVVVQPSSGNPCELLMFEEEDTAVPKVTLAPATSTPRASKALNDRNAGLTQEELDLGIEKLTDTRFNIQRSIVDKVLANQGSLMKTARVIPHEENGRVVGVKLYGIRRNSLLGRLGIQNGDVLRTINGFDMSSPDTALEAYSRLRSSDKLTVAIKRRNQEMTIEYNIQ